MKHLATFLLAMLFILTPDRALAGEMRRPLSEKSPMYIYHIDVWNAADPQKIIDLIPEDVRPYVVLNISLSVTIDRTKDGFRTAESWLRTCAENRMWAFIQPASGGHSWFSDYDLSVYRYFFENYPNLLGFNYCEQFWGFNEREGLHPFGPASPTISDRMKHFTNLLDLCDEFGGYLVISNCLVIPEWDSTSPLTMYRVYPNFAAKAKEKQKNLIYCEKYTTSGNFYDMESMCLGVWLSGYSGYYGMRFDQCGYTEHSSKFPESIGGMTMMEHMMMTGQTVTDGPELIWQQCIRNQKDQLLSDGYRTRVWDFYPQFPNVYLDVWRKFTTDGVLRIMDRKEVIDSTKVAIWNERSLSSGWYGRRSEQKLFSGLYALDNGTFGTDTVYLKKTGRYPTVPTMPAGDVEGFQFILKQSEYSKTWPTNAHKQNYFNTLFAPQAEDDPNGGLYVRHIDNNWLVYNTSQYEDKSKIQTSTLSLLYNSCDKVKFTMPMCSFGLVTEKADGLDLYLNNYRSFTSAQTTDVIAISGCKAQPTYTVKERGSHKASTVTSEYSNGVLTLTVTHNGPLDIAVKCEGNNTNRPTIPVFEKTYGAVIPPVYTGTRQYELENADYMNVDKNGDGISFSNIQGFTALGYVSWGTNRAASLRDTIRIDEAGTYKMAIRYLAPAADMKSINVTLNDKVVSRNTQFPKTDDQTWATKEIEVELKQGINVVRFSNIAAQTNPLYLDNFTLTPIAPAGIVELKADGVKRSADYFNLAGQRIQRSSLKKGDIYINNGKKFIHQ